MPPKVKVNREDIINAAVALVRRSGAESINARNVAFEIGCSTQPVFSNFTTMEELRLAVVKKADEMCAEYMQRETQSGKYPPYKASGMGYICFAKEEKELFKLLYMRDRSDESAPDKDEIDDNMAGIIHDATGLEGIDLRLFHLEMWAIVHGIASMLATGFFDLDTELISKMITDTYKGLRTQYGME